MDECPPLNFAEESHGPKVELTMARNGPPGKGFRVPGEASTTTISEEQICQYERDGVICLRGLFDAEWIERLRIATDRLLADGGQDMRSGEDK